jgi:predicted PurR-regulated permease PerM
MKIEWKTCFKIGVSIFLLYLCITYWSEVAKVLGTVIGAASPLIIGFVIAYIVNIIMCCYERYYFPKSDKKIVKITRRPVSMILAFVTVVALITAIIVLIVPELVNCVKIIIDGLPGFIDNAVVKLNNLSFVSDKAIAYLSEIDWQSKIGSISETVATGFVDIVGGIVSVVTSIFSGVVTAFLSIIFSVYMLLSKNRIASQLDRVSKRYIKVKVYERIKYVLKVLDDSFHRYIVGQCTEAVILGILCIVGMLILGLPYATMIGSLIAFTALIPIAGAYIGAGLGAFIILVSAGEGGPLKALIFIIYIVILQQLEGNLIYPKVVGSSLGLPGIWVLAAVTVGGGVFGIPGMIIGVPLTEAIWRIVKDDVDKKEIGKTEEINISQI